MSAVIIAIGMVSALHLFVWLCFVKPDAANALVPLLFLPLVKALLDMLRGHKNE